MKKIILSLLLLAPCGFLIAQDRQHPSDRVQHAFQRDYPEAKEPHWSQNNGRWHARFDDRSAYDRGEMIAHYDRYGRHIESHTFYNHEDVPAPVMERARTRYHGDNYRFTRIERPGTPSFFKIQFTLGGRERTTYLDERGRERNY
jgi:hypothetical protein